MKLAKPLLSPELNRERYFKQIVLKQHNISNNIFVYTLVQDLRLTSKLVPTAFVAVGGYSSLIEQYFEKEPSPNVTLYDANNRSCGAPREDAMHMFR